MLKILVFISFLLPANFTPAPETATCTCPDVTNVQKTGQTGSSLTYSWNGGMGSTQYKVWYVRQEDGHFSGYSYTSNTSFSFTSLTPGHYTLYFQTVCGETNSNYIGVEDVINA